MKLTEKGRRKILSRIYINSDEVRFTKNGLNHVDAEFYDGTRMYDLEPRRLFPVSGLDNISLYSMKTETKKRLSEMFRT